MIAKTLFERIKKRLYQFLYSPLNNGQRRFVGSGVSLRSAFFYCLTAAGKKEVAKIAPGQ
jgi:hypothetical protein